MMEDKLIKKIQDKSLELLDMTIDILNAHGISWFAYYGTLLGAVREGGMIPWDDDVDIAVPRKYFNRIIESGKTWFKEPLFLEKFEDSGMLRHFLRVKMSGTSHIKRAYFGSSSHFGMYLDIFPIDHIPEDNIKRRSVKLTIYGLVTNMGDALYGVCSRNKNISFSEVNYSYNTLMTLLNNAYISSSVVVQSGYPQKFSELPASCFDSFTEVSFKHLRNKLRLPNNAEKVLEIEYGADWNIPKNYGRLVRDIIDPEKDYKYYMSLSEEEFNKIFDNKKW